MTKMNNGPEDTPTTTVLDDYEALCAAERDRHRVRVGEVSMELARLSRLRVEAKKVYDLASKSESYQAELLQMLIEERPK